MLHLSQVSATQEIMVKKDILNMLSVCVRDVFHMVLLSQGALVWFLWRLANDYTSLWSVCRPALHFWTSNVCVHLCVCVFACLY